MIRIDCPFCGPRDETEFTYGGDASRARPPLDETSEEVWNTYVFLRPNERGLHEEYWFHQHGCRAWLKVTRDMVSHAISEVVFARKDKST
ncbi:sarcosine oxidase subunit delta [Sneathiella sp.]|uniref:sarcosine oxidase subunit delta n=1 Tax=Sneathiella sp. TaxID=1964365 RepID=UPI0035645423